MRQPVSVLLPDIGAFFGQADQLTPTTRSEFVLSQIMQKLTVSVVGDMFICLASAPNNPLVALHRAQLCGWRVLDRHMQSWSSQNTEPVSKNREK